MDRRDFSIKDNFITFKIAYGLVGDSIATNTFLYAFYEKLTS
jgi:hypothetical protein